MRDWWRFLAGALVLVCFPVSAQGPVRGGRPEGTGREGSRNPNPTPRVTPGRTIRLRAPLPGELPQTSATLAPEVTPTPPPLRVTEPRDPAQVIVATVGGEQLNLKDVQDQVARIRSPLFSGPKEDVERYRRSFARQIINDWVDQKLLAVEARARGLTSTRQEVDRYIEGTAQDTGLRIPLAERLRQLGVAEDKFRATVEDTVLGDKLVRQTIREKVTDAVLDKAIKDNPLMFLAPPKRHVQQLFHSFQGAETPREVAAMESKMKSIRRRLAWFGGKFEDYAQDRAIPNLFVYDLWLAVGDRLDANRQFIYSFIFRLEPVRPGKESQYVLKKGELSDVVASPAGFHIFKVVEEQPPRRKTIEECRTDVENSFFDQVRSGLIRELERKRQIQRDPEGIFANGTERTLPLPPRTLPRSPERGSALSPAARPETGPPIPPSSSLPTTRTSNAPLRRPTPRALSPGNAR